MSTHRPSVLFFVEGFTDIRFVLALSEVSRLTLCVPATSYEASGLGERLAASGAPVRVATVPGGRAAFQLRSLQWLWRHAKEFDVIVSQEMLRGSLNATILGRLRSVPVITYTAIPAVEYFRCRRDRGQLGAFPAAVGELAIRALLTINGRLATTTVALGDYLRTVAARYSRHTVNGHYYGVDTAYFRPVSADERRQLRAALDLPLDSFIVFLASRISHEKDPETALRAVGLLRAEGMDVRLLNLSGGYREFLELAQRLALPDASDWVMARPAAHPMRELAAYFQACDVTAQASLAEGLGLSPLESLACGTPVVATEVGGMAVHLRGAARLVPRGDVRAMADALAWVARHPDEARRQALDARTMVVRDWSRERAIESLREVIDSVSGVRTGKAA
jgi:glycosyltransferase involved in cell wall biosynthesis